MHASAQSNRRIKLLALDSTLASEAPHTLSLGKYGRAIGLAALTPAQIVERLPELQRVATVEPDQHVYTRDPEHAAPAETIWARFARHLEEMFTADPGVAGAVVIQGTDQLEEVAYFLNLTVHAGRPVVIVGAQRPWNVLSSDGPLNLVNAVRTAAEANAAGRGVLVVLNDTIHAARDVTKTNTYRVQTFQSPDTGPLGYADPDAVVFYRRPERRHTTASELAAPADGVFPRVDILYGYGADGGLVRAAVDLGAAGLVIAGSGAGSLWGMKEALQGAMAQGVAVVRSSRVGSGRVLVESNSGGPGLVAADDLNPQKARVLLLLALMQTRDPVDLQRLYDEY